MTYKVTFSGIDGSGRSTVIDTLSRRFLDIGLKTVHPYRPSFADTPEDGRQYFHVGLNSAMDGLHRFLDYNEQKLLVGLLNMGYGKVQAFIEEHAVRRFNPDLVLVSRNQLLDPAVYSTYYFPFSRKLSPEARLRVAALINKLAVPNLHLYMDLDPELAYTRILKRIEEEKAKGNSHRRKWSHMHENVKDMTFLRERFEETLEILVQKNIIRVDASRPKEEVADEIFQLIKSGMGSLQNPSILPAPQQ